MRERKNPLFYWSIEILSWFTTVSIIFSNKMLHYKNNIETAVVGFPGGSGVKNPSAVGGHGFNPWVGKIPWRRKWQSSTLAWEIQWTEKPGGLHSMRLQRIWNNLMTKHTHTHTHSFVNYVFQSVWATILGCHRLGDLQTTEIYFSWFWRLGNSRSRHWKCDVWWKPTS